MAVRGWIQALSSWLSEAMAWSHRNRKFACADCPIVMSCGLEPRENCLPRLEAMARGARRGIGPWDTCISERRM